MKKLTVVCAVLVGIGIASALHGQTKASIEKRAPDNSAQDKASTVHAPRPQKSSILSVTADADGRTLLIRYALSGGTQERRWTLPGEVVEFRYCPWLGDAGIAVVAMTRGAETNDFYYTAFYFKQPPGDLKPARIPALPGNNKLLGIANTGGDSLVITAIQHHRSAPGERIAGWTYIDNCPMPGMAIGQVTPFEFAAQQPSPPKSSPPNSANLPAPSPQPQTH